MIDGDHPLLLGSASPRRRELLAGLGLPLRVVSASFDEARLAGERAPAYLERVVAGKLAAVAATGAGAGAGALLVADTVVLLGDDLLGKPRDEDDRRAMIRALSGREHQVWTRFAIAAPEAAAHAVHAETVRTRVVFRALDEDEITGYAASGEGADKAGAYAIQGLGGFAVARLEGSYANVVGLPVCEVVAALRRAGLLGRFPLRTG